MSNLSNDIKFINCAPASSELWSGASTGIPVDMQGYDGVVFMGTLTSAAAASSMVLTAYEGATTAAFVTLAAGGAYAYIVETSVASNARDLIVVDVFRPKDRYVCCGGVSSTTDGFTAMHALQYHADNRPVVQATGYLPATAHVVVATPTT